jgi:hypothetical protein
MTNLLRCVVTCVQDVRPDGWLSWLTAAYTHTKRAATILTCICRHAFPLSNPLHEVSNGLETDRTIARFGNVSLKKHAQARIPQGTQHRATAHYVTVTVTGSYRSRVVTRFSVRFKPSAPVHGYKPTYLYGNRKLPSSSVLDMSKPHGLYDDTLILHYTWLAGARLPLRQCRSQSLYCATIHHLGQGCSDYGAARHVCPSCQQSSSSRLQDSEILGATGGWGWPGLGVSQPHGGCVFWHASQPHGDLCGGSEPCQHLEVTTIMLADNIVMPCPRRLDVLVQPC